MAVTPPVGIVAGVGRSDAAGDQAGVGLSVGLGAGVGLGVGLGVGGSRIGAAAGTDAGGEGAGRVGDGASAAVREALHPAAASRMAKPAAAIRFVNEAPLR
jgi:hypothetical protein